jgi:small subunit ribosomal protein S18
MRMMPRRWRKGDVYAPKDLSHVEAKRFRHTQAPPAVDIVDMMGFNPIDNYRVCLFLLV